MSSGVGGVASTLPWNWFGGQIGTAVFPAWDEEVGAHEIGHAFGIASHIEDNPDYPFSGIGEYGVHLKYYGTVMVNHPGRSQDIMSTRPGWVSPYTYNDLLCKTMNLYWTYGPVDAVPSKIQLSERVVVRGILWPDSGRVKLRLLYHKRLYQDRPWRYSTQFEIALVNKHGDTLVAEPIRTRRPKKGLIRILQTIPLYRGTVALEIRDDKKVLIRVDRDVGRPMIKDLRLAKGKTGWSLEWDSNHRDSNHSEEHKLVYDVAITFDNGKSWQPLATELIEPMYSFDSSKQAGGDECRLRVFAHDGFNSAYVDTETFSIPLQPPLIIPVNFKDGEDLPASRLHFLRVETISPRFGSLDDDQIRWESKTEGVLGIGRIIQVDLKEGEHEITVYAETSPSCIAQRTFKLQATLEQEDNINHIKKNIEKES